MRPKSLLEMAAPTSNAIYQSVELRHPPEHPIDVSITNLSQEQMHSALIARNASVPEISTRRISEIYTPFGSQIKAKR